MLKASSFAFLIGGTLCAAAGQILLKIGADGRLTPLEFLNRWVILGLGLYGISAVFWVLALSKLRLVVVFPFTVLTIAFVYLGSYFILRESITTWGILGLCLVIAGLVTIVLGG